MAHRVARAARRAVDRLPLRGFRHGRVIYLRHVAGLFRPGRLIVVPAAHQVQSGSLDGWGEEDLKLIIEEGRRQLDRQNSNFEHILSRAQWVFTVGVAIVAALTAALFKSRPSWPTIAVGALAFVVVVYGVAGAASIMVVRADFKTIDTALLSQRTPPIQKGLAADYSTMIATGENTIAARLTVFHEAVLYLIIGGILGLAGVLAHA